MNQEQIDYVRTELARGVDPETLRATLRQNGYGEELVTALLDRVNGRPSTPPQPATAAIPTAPSIAATQSGASMAIPKAPQTAATTEAPKQGVSIWVYAAAAAVFLVILALVGTVLGSVNDARDSGMDASAMQMLGNLRSQAEIYSARSANGYEGLCESTVVVGLLETPIATAECVDSPERFRASVELNSGEYFCVAGLAAEGGELPATGRFASAPSGYTCE